jgi:hypothetical protein
MTIFNDWLNSTDQIKCVLIEVQVYDGSSEQNLYFSSRPFQDTSNTYAPVVRSDSIVIAERLSLSGGSGASIGDIELDNTDGSLDQNLYSVWSMRPCKIYFGDVRWNRSDFKLVFNGIIDDIATKDRDSFNLKIRDKMLRLDSPITETTLGGVSQNKDSLIPITLGEVFNVTPLLVDSANLD